MTAQTPAEAIAALDAALASGELTIEYQGRRITYRSVPELMTARGHFERLANAVAPGEAAPAAQSRVTYASFARD